MFSTMPLNPAYTEIQKLHDILEKYEIPHDILRLLDGWTIKYPSANPKDMKCSIIEHMGSYGHENDRLEIMGLLTEEEGESDDVLGNLTASNVLLRIMQDMYG